MLTCKNFEVLLQGMSVAAWQILSMSIFTDIVSPVLNRNLALCDKHYQRYKCSLFVLHLIYSKI